MGKYRILVLDDHILVRDLLVTAIAGMEGVGSISSASSITEAVSLCRGQPMDLVVSEWHLPDGSGLELSRSLRDLSPQPKLLILSGDELDGIVRDAAQSGVHGFVSKRQPLSVLKDAIQAIQGGNCFYCPKSSRMLLEAMKEKAPSQAHPLTNREREILKRLASGVSTKDMAQGLGLSPKTISNHITILKDKLGIQEPAGLVLYAHRHGLIRLQ